MLQVGLLFMYFERKYFCFLQLRRMILRWKRKIVSWCPPPLSSILAPKRGYAKDVDYQALGARIRQYRLEQGWSQEELASQAGVSDRTVRNAENKAHMARLETIEMLASAFHMHPAKLLYPELFPDS